MCLYPKNRFLGEDDGYSVRTGLLNPLKLGEITKGS